MDCWIKQIAGKCVSVFSALLMGYSAGAQTTTNVYWDFSNPSGPDQPTSGLIDGLTTILSFGNAASLNYNNSSASSDYTTAAGFAASGSTNALVAARVGAFDLGTNTYFSFSLSLGASAGTSYSITDISLGTRSTASGPSSLGLYFSTDDTSFAAVGSPATVSQNGQWAAVDFPGASITLPDDGSTIYLRLYGTGSTSTSSGNWRIDDLAVTISPVPEPSVFALSLLGGATLLPGFRRRK